MLLRAIVKMKFSSIASALALTASVAAAPKKGCPGNSTLPYTTIAGVKVVDTPLVRQARELMEANFEPFLIRHVYRTWLFGAATINNNATLTAKIDAEAHAIACLLHDVGWDDKRFEVDAAIYTVNFLRKNGVEGEWKARRTNPIWHGIALHATSSIGLYSEDLMVNFIVESINMDHPGPHPKFSVEDYDNIVAAYPMDGLGEGTNRAFAHIASYKPEVTYDTFLEPWGVAYVEGYNPVGHRLFDRGNANVSSPVPMRRNVHGL
ncbi:hypothetical protein RRF57_003428 [Xylaria bambusicola]|uniref:HD domain-containing protein n=1 Tax=Xylaria bambusicola TaxID=326684 RepID=A0AAN7Z5E5_9PEZI